MEIDRNKNFSVFLYFQADSKLNPIFLFIMANASSLQLLCANKYDAIMHQAIVFISTPRQGMWWNIFSHAHWFKIFLFKSSSNSMKEKLEAFFLFLLSTLYKIHNIVTQISFHLLSFQWTKTNIFVWIAFHVFITLTLC